MKKVLNIIIVFLMIILSTACYNAQANMKIKQDKSIELSVKILQMDSEELTEENYLVNKNYYDQRDIKIEKITEDGKVGYAISKSYKNIDEISTDNYISVDIYKYLERDFDDSKLFKFEKRYFSTIYSAHFKVNDGEYKEKLILEKENKEKFISLIKDMYNKVISNYENDKLPKKYTNEDNLLEISDEITYLITIDENGSILNISVNDGYYSYNKEKVSLEDIVENDITKLSEEIEDDKMHLGEIKFTLDLPFESIDNNADKVSNNGKTLTWIFDKNKIDNEIKFSFKFENNKNYLAMFIASIILIILIVAVIIFISKLRGLIRRKEENKPIYKSSEIDFENNDIPNIISIEEDK